VFEALSLTMHGLEALETEVIFTTCAENLRLLHCARRAVTANCSCLRGVILPRALTVSMQAIVTRRAKRHQALLAFHCGLQDATILAGNLKVAELLVKQHVRLLKQ
jgi:hypothetical protein